MINWKTYNQELIKRGEILIERDFFSAEQDKTKKRPGRPKEYPDSLIIFTLIIKFLMRFAYRQLQGYLSSLFAGSGFKVPNFRTIHYRFKKLAQILESQIIDFDSLPDNFVIAIDATGLKLYNREEWNRKKHKRRSRKGWIKIHVAVDVESKQLVDVKITQDNVHDSKMAIPIVEGVVEKAQSKGKKLEKVFADKGYDTHEIFNKLKQKGIVAGIIPRKSARIRGDSARDRVVRKLRRMGIRKYWEKECSGELFLSV